MAKPGPRRGEEEEKEEGRGKGRKRKGIRSCQGLKITCTFNPCVGRPKGPCGWSLLFSLHRIPNRVRAELEP